MCIREFPIKNLTIQLIKKELTAAELCWLLKEEEKQSPFLICFDINLMKPCNIESDVFNKKPSKWIKIKVSTNEFAQKLIKHTYFFPCYK